MGLVFFDFNTAKGRDIVPHCRADLRSLCVVFPAFLRARVYSSFNRQFYIRDLWAS